jgi:hypothetical protein
MIFEMSVDIIFNMLILIFNDDITNLIDLTMQILVNNNDSKLKIRTIRLII